MSNLTLFKSGGALSTKFNAMVQAGLGTDLGEGIRGSYGIVSIKAGRFRIKYKGAEHIITAPGANGGQPAPVASIDVVIVKANPFLNKQYYKGRYVEGSNSPPDCYSLDGKVPSAAVKNPVHSNCALCPMNQFGSLIGDNGVNQKACRDTKKLAIVPVADIKNESLGGAMLFRVPPSSLKDLSSLADGLKARGYPYNSVVVRIGFDMEVSHPKPTFDAIRPLSDAEADAVLELFNSDSVERVLADNDPVVESDAAAPVAATQPVVTPVAMPAAPTPQPAPPPPPVNQPVAAPVQPNQPLPVGAVVVQPFSPSAPPPPPAAAFQQPAPAPMPIAAVFAATPVPPGAMETAEEPPAAEPVKTRTKRQPTAPVASPEAPVAAEPITPAGSQLDNDISGILAGLSAFGGGK